MVCYLFFFFFKQKTAYEMRISDWSSDVCSSDLAGSSTTCPSTETQPPLMYCSASVREHPARSATRFDSRTGSDMDQRRGIRTRSVPIRRSGTLRLFSRHWNAGQPQPAARGAGRSRVGSLEREETRQPPDRAGSPVGVEI